MKINIMMVLALLATQVLLGNTTKDHSITIFVHGTYLMRKILQYSPYRQQIYCPQGLTLAKNLPSHYHFSKIAHGCVACDNESYSIEQFYVFGWQSEHVSDAARKKAAKVLVEQMYEVVVDYYVRHQVVPKIRLIGFSHGGNVILHAADYVPFYADMNDLEIEAWLFGTPVQVVTHDLVNSDCFSNIYSIYSKKDVVQVLDPQGLRDRSLTKNHFWSGRTFCEFSRCVQVDFTVNGQAIAHAYYNFIFQYFPKIKKIIEEKSGHLHAGGTIAVDFKI
ncbi:hypothetical protein KBC04_01180 [Candidatus Babeliales bacterium]|nr:hypothetical protein [Candidatus Babeliales bacterium]MBP9843661.1 hypothetical protein [Candidatus Babeliales bacterium]